MAKTQEKRTFLFNLEWKKALEEYPPEIRLEVYEGIMDYALTGIVPEFSPLSKMAFSFIKQGLDFNKEKYEQTCEKNKANGKMGGAPVGNSNASKKQPKQPKQPKISETTLYENDNENEYEYDNENEKDNVACATTRARSEVLSIDEIEKEIINAESKAETLQMLYHISKEDYESIRDEILAEWKFRDYANTLSDAMHHFVNLVRVKAKSLKHPPNVPAKELSGRQRDFWQQVQSFAERYDEEMLKAFYAKWAEADASGRYMKWEFEDGFDIGKRLAKFHAYWSKT